MYSKRMIALVVMFLLLLSIFSIAEDADTSTEVNSDTNTETQPIFASQTVSKANSCGFWCKINTFLFGSAENRAGKGWFDRKEALVGKSITLTEPQQKQFEALKTKLKWKGFSDNQLKKLVKETSPGEGGYVKINDQIIQFYFPDQPANVQYGTLADTFSKDSKIAETYNQWVKESKNPNEVIKTNEFLKFEQAVKYLSPSNAAWLAINDPSITVSTAPSCQGSICTMTIVTGGSSDVSTTTVSNTQYEISKEAFTKLFTGESMNTNENEVKEVVGGYKSWLIIHPEGNVDQYFQERDKTERDAFWDTQKSEFMSKSNLDEGIAREYFDYVQPDEAAKLYSLGIFPDDLEDLFNSGKDYTQIVSLAEQGYDKDAIIAYSGETESSPAGGPAPTASTPTDDTESSSASPSSTSSGGSSAAAPVYTVTKSEVGADGTITIEGTTATGAQSKHEYKKIGKQLNGKEIYQYYAQGSVSPSSEWYVQEGEELVRVIKIEDNWKYLGNDNNPTTELSQAKRSEFVANDQEVKLSIDGTQVIVNSKIVGKHAIVKLASVTSAAAPTKDKSTEPPKTYNSELSNVLGEGKIPGNIKDKYFDKTTGELKEGYTFSGKNTADQIDINTESNKPILQITKKEGGVVSVKETLPPKEKDGKQTYTHTLLLNGQDFATQTTAQKEAGKAVIQGNTVLMKEDKFISDLDFSEQQLFYEDEEDKSNGVVKSALQVGDGKITYTDAEEETQVITDTTAKEITELEGDWEKDDTEFTPSDGTIFEIDPKTGKKGKAKYLADYDYKDKKLDTVELFDPLSGQYKGATFTKLGDYEGVKMLQQKDGSVVFEYKGKTSEKYTQDSSGNWKTAKGKSVSTFLGNTKEPSNELSGQEKEYLKKSESIQEKVDLYENAKTVSERKTKIDSDVEFSSKYFTKNPDLGSTSMIQLQQWAEESSTSTEFHAKVYEANPALSGTNQYNEIVKAKEQNYNDLTGFFDLIKKKQKADTEFGKINTADLEINGDVLTSFSSGSLTPSQLQDPITQEQIVKALGYTSMDDYAKEKGIKKTEPTITPTSGSEWTGKFDQKGNIVLTLEHNDHTDTLTYTPVTQVGGKIVYQWVDTPSIYVDTSGQRYTKEEKEGVTTWKQIDGTTAIGQFVTINEGGLNLNEVAASLEQDQASIQEAKKKQEEAEKQVADDAVLIKQLNAQYLTSTERTAQTVLSSIYAAATSVKDYPALSKVLGISDWWKGVFEDSFMENFVTTADQTFAPMLGMNWFPSAICESHYDLEPEGTAMIKTPTGTYQAIAHIEGERSSTKSPILCQRNPDQEAEQEWLCDDYQVCLDNSFCYADQDQNNQPDDEEKQLNGYFYKITWGVSAPSDETFTPFIDENGVAVSFNVVIKNTNTVEPLYSKGADIDGPIELKNGDSDMDVILHYSPNLYSEVCIEWEQAPSTSGDFTGTETIGDVCFDLITSSVGEVNWQSGGKPSSTKAADPEVSLSTGW